MKLTQQAYLDGLGDLITGVLIACVAEDQAERVHDDPMCRTSQSQIILYDARRDRSVAVRLYQLYLAEHESEQ